MRRLTKNILLICMFGFSQGCASVTSNPAKLDLNIGDGKAIVATNYTGETAAYPWSTSLSLIQYVPERARKYPDKPPGYGAIYTLKSRPEQNGYSLATVNPGLYYISHGIIQTNWSGCFNKNTILVAVMPDTVTYLGAINLDQFYLEVSEKIKADGQEKIRFEINKTNKPIVMKNDLNYSPQFSAVGQEDLNGLSDYLLSEGANINVPVVSAKTRNISFPKGVDGCSSVWF